MGGFSNTGSPEAKRPPRKQTEEEMLVKQDTNATARNQSREAALESAVDYLRQQLAEAEASQRAAEDEIETTKREAEASVRAAKASQREAEAGMDEAYRMQSQTCRDFTRIHVRQRTFQMVFRKYMERGGLPEDLRHDLGQLFDEMVPARNEEVERGTEACSSPSAVSLSPEDEEQRKAAQKRDEDERNAADMKAMVDYRVKCEMACQDLADLPQATRRADAGGEGPQLAIKEPSYQRAKDVFRELFTGWYGPWEEKD